MSGSRSSRGPGDAGRRTSGRRQSEPRSKARPEQRRRTATSARRTVPDPAERPAEELPAPVVRRRFTSRAAVLLAVVVLLIVGLAYPLREYVAQRAQIRELEQKQDKQEKDIAALQREQRRWQDPAYVEQQARERLHYAKPGEVTYVVIDDDGGSGADGGRGGDEKTGPSWSQRLWSSVRVADRPGT